MNKPAARKLLRHLMKQQLSPSAARFNMRYWGNPRSEVTVEVLEEPICNTQACMAGETVLALGGGYLVKGIGGINLYREFRIKELDIEDTAAKLLDLTEEEQSRLFYFKSMGYERGWPKRYETSYKAATTASARLAVAIRRLEHFIVTNGKS